ncbi:hypothetical protein BKA83DRAFT_4500249 [Pisolithus microcarpus]|nr:hypothetical protein BKA83DRAFT_4500249 [Pisolithus microcarpus]
MSMAKIDKFLSLSSVRTLPLSFWTAKELRSRIELLPTTPHWNYRIIATSYPTKSPAILYLHDSLKCIEALFNHLVERVVREFSEWMSGDMAWQMQSKLPPGTMLCIVIFSSDKTHITSMCGGKVAHPLLISLANIKMAVWNKASLHAFLLNALMPIVEFIHPMHQMCSVLEAHLFHECLDIVLQPLKVAAQIG